MFSSDITMGLDVLKLTGTNGIPSANAVKQDYFNAQTQYRLDVVHVDSGLRRRRSAEP